MSLINSIKSQTASICIIGAGYVGLPLALAFVESGFDVLSFDNDPSKVASLNNGVSYLNHIDSQRVKAALNTNRFRSSSKPSDISSSSVFIICVPTPLGVHQEPDLSYIYQSLDLIRDYLAPPSLVVLESTTYPGTTDEILLPFLSERFALDRDFYLAFSPEREDPGNTSYSLKDIPKVVGAVSQASLEHTVLLYDNIVNKVVSVSSARVAELSKLLENVHRAVNIGLVNELKILTDKMDIDPFEVISAASSKPFGFVPYYPGPGLGGHCIPIDPFYLTWKAKEFGTHTRFIELSGQINSFMPEFVVQKVISVLNSVGLSVRNSNVFVLGVSYKKNVSDTRESPAYPIINSLLQLGANLSYSDPFVASFDVGSPSSSPLTLHSTTITSESLSSFDIILILTDHDSFDYDLILNHSSLIVDCRGRFPTSEVVIRG